MILLVYLLLSLSLLIIGFFLGKTINKLPTNYPQYKPFNQLKNFFLTMGTLSLISLIGGLIKLKFLLTPTIPLLLIITFFIGSMILGFKLAKTFQ